MRMPKRGEKGFTLIELLIVVAILGVLAAVIIPNVGRFFGKGEEEARRTEKHNIETAVINLMMENDLPNGLIPNSVDASGNAVKDMRAFPDSTSVCGTAAKYADPDGGLYGVGDANGYLLYGHDIKADGAVTPTVNYVTMTSTKYYYTCEADGTVLQWKDAAKSVGYTD